ncbi:HNH endonuclease [Streptomyces pinistramenti]|uniref:HNH endonuclease n=1 Tax=Streptomyces pinistramenti TaxID=2884812 RepID=UPI001D069D17|nr:HNH endonuclease signature motif containing protein [Streptomyces pinistramenti]MCB5907701.1 HNH endonuclease [Streptomyces pinistramenti]
MSCERSCPANDNQRARSPCSPLGMDHVRPLSRGGEDVDGNVQVLCRECHGRKTATEFGASASR